MALIRAVNCVIFLCLATELAISSANVLPEGHAVSSDAVDSKECGNGPPTHMVRVNLKH